MDNFGLAILIAWICLILWLFWYVKVQLERLNADVFSKTKAIIYENMDKSSGALRLFGIIWYSPYVWPAVSLIVWALIASTLFLTGGF